MHFLYRRYYGCIMALSVCCAQLRAASLSGPFLFPGEVRLDEAKVSFVGSTQPGAEHLFLAKQTRGQEYFGSTVAVDTSALTIPPIMSKVVSEKLGYEGFHDVWSAARDLNAPSSVTIRYDFLLDGGSRETSKVLSLGCVDAASIFLNGEGIFGIVGRRDLFLHENLVVIKLKSGKNILSVFTKKTDPWDKVPEHHFQNPWQISVSLFDEAEAAWRAHTSNLFHPLHVPIVSTVSEICIETTAAGHSGAQLYDLSGRLVGEGEIGGNGSIVWRESDPVLQKPFLGLLICGKTQGEPVIVLNGTSLEKMIPNWVHERDDSLDVELWRHRVQHLISVNEDSRDPWWQRKFVEAFYEATNDIKNAPLRSLEERCAVLRVHLRGFRSKIDGSTQFYREFKGGEAGRPVLFLLPTVTNPVRPPIEAEQFADQQYVEAMCSMAANYHLNLVFPGYNETDYGGDLSLKELSECAQSYSEKADIKNTYVYGLCSAGVTALRSSSALPVFQGMILYSPVLKRKHMFWLPGSEMTPFNYPENMYAAEAPHSVTPEILKMRSLLLFDSEIQGHGDLGDSKQLVAKLKFEGAEISETYPSPTQDYVWGERLKRRTSEWMAWTANDTVKPFTVQVVAELSRSPPVTIKQALLSGFYLDRTDDADLRRWLEGWSSMYRLYRGSPLPSAKREDAIPVKFSATPPEWVKEQIRDFDGNENGASNASALFGYYLSSEGGALSVRVFRKGVAEGKVPLPAVDPLLEGSAKAVIYGFMKKRWQILVVIP